MGVILLFYSLIGCLFGIIGIWHHSTRSQNPHKTKYYIAILIISVLVFSTKAMHGILSFIFEPSEKHVVAEQPELEKPGLIPKPSDNDVTEKSESSEDKLLEDMLRANYEKLKLSDDKTHVEVVVSLPESYNEYNPEIHKSYRESIINDGVGETLSVAGEVFYNLPNTQNVEVLVKLHGESILRLEVTREQWDNKNLNLDNPLWESYLDSVGDGWKLEIYIS